MTTFTFDDCELDVDAFQLRVGGLPQPIEPQVFDVLALLVRHRHRMVSKEELLDVVWRHRFVTESAVSSRIKSARRAIGDDGREQRLIRTIHSRGYQFIGDAHVAERATFRNPARDPGPRTLTCAEESDPDVDVRDSVRAALFKLLDRSPDAGDVGHFVDEAFQERALLHVFDRFQQSQASPALSFDSCTGRDVCSC